MSAGLYFDLLLCGKVAHLLLDLFMHLLSFGIHEKNHRPLLYADQLSA